MVSTATDFPRLSLARDGDTLVIRVGGSWNLRSGIPPIAEVDRVLEASSPPGRARVEAGGLDRWDSSLALVLTRIERACRQRDIPFAIDDAMPAGLRQLVAVADGGAAPLLGRDAPSDRQASSEEGEPTAAPPLTEAIGSWAITWIASLDEKLEFLGSTTIALGRMLLGRTRRLGLGFGLALQQAGVGTLPVLALFALASGAVLSMLSTQQLDRFGASQLAPNLVAIVILRELAALTTGIVLAGRIGSANAAELGAMVAAGETDALDIVGGNAFDMFVAPRVLALAIAGPLLVMYANAIGLIGSVSVAAGLLDTPLQELLEKTRAALSFKHAIAGLVKGAAYGTVVGLASCYYGLRSGRNAGAVGRAVQSSVVAGVLGVVVADAVLTIFFKYVRL